MEESKHTVTDHGQHWSMLQTEDTHLQLVFNAAVAFHVEITRFSPEYHKTLITWRTVLCPLG